MMIVIADYHMGNTGSVKNALAALGHESVISNSRTDFAAASHIILPGVGSFGDGMKNLKEAGLESILNDEVLKKRKPVLGICLGMQMMAEVGEEGSLHEGLGWIKGKAVRFGPSVTPVPHVGWNDVAVKNDALLFRGISKPIFYFVHSYVLALSDQECIAGETQYGKLFTSAIECGNIFGVQFHPEKSQQAGLKVLENFLQ